jgi:hypothetical protein
VTAEGVGTNWEPLRAQIKEIYANLYRATWSYPATAGTLAAVSNLVRTTLGPFFCDVYLKYVSVFTQLMCAHKCRSVYVKV